jgi:hypothetical protein
VNGCIASKLVKNWGGSGTVLNKIAKIDLFSAIAVGLSGQADCENSGHRIEYSAVSSLFTANEDD